MKVTLRDGVQIVGTLPSGTGDNILTTDTTSVGSIPAIDSSNFLTTTLADGKIIVGNGSNVATAVTPGGDATISNAGVIAISAGVIVNADINASAAIDASKIANGTVSSTEFQYLGNVTSDIQTQLDAKAPINNATFTGTTTVAQIVDSGLTANTIPYANGSKQLTSSSVTPTELGYLSGVTSSIQTQFSGKLSASISSPADGDIIYRNSGVWINLPRGTTGQVLTSTAGSIQWASGASNGLPAGGSTAQFLNKINGTDYNAQWHTLVVSDLTDLTSSASELNKLTGVTTTPSQLNYLNTATSNIQTQINSKLTNSLAQNSLWVGNVSNVATVLGPGTNGYVLTSVSGVPTWQASASVALTNGSGTTANGSAVDLGGTVDVDGIINIPDDEVTPITIRISSDNSSYQSRAFFEVVSSDGGSEVGHSSFGIKSTTDSSAIYISSTRTDVNEFGLKIYDTRAGALATGLEYASDISSTLGSLSLINKGAADNRYWVQTGNSGLSGNHLFGTNSGILGTSAVTTSSAYFRIQTATNNRSVTFLSSDSATGHSVIRSESDSGTNISIATLGTGTSSSTVSKGIIVTSNGDVDFLGGIYKFEGTSAQAAEIRLYEDTDDGTNYTAFKVGTQTGDVTYTLPTASPASNGYVLSSTTGGVMSWIATITNSAANNELMKSDGTNSVSSGLFSTVAGDITLGTGLSGTARTLTSTGSGTNVGLTISTKGNGDLLFLSTSGFGWNMSGSSNTLSVAGLGDAIIAGSIGVGGHTQGYDMSIRAGAAQVSGGGAGGVLNLTSGAPDGAGAEGAVNIQTRSGGKIGFFNTSAVAKQISGGDLTNNVTSGGTTDQIDDFTSLTVYATDAAAIRNDIYQLARKLKQVNDALRLYGILT